MAGNQNQAKAPEVASDKLAKIPGTYRNPLAITERLQYAAKHFNLITPMTSCGTLPDGFSVALSTVLIDIDRETYKVQGGYGLSKVALDKISAAAGISWDSQASGRIDRGDHPFYCAWRAVGYVRDFDGTWRALPPGTREMDLRDGSAVALAESAAQLREKRIHIASHCETKARLRAVRSMGIRGSYTAEELKRPFVVVRCMPTGESSDPVLRREFARAIFAKALEGGRAVYGHDHVGSPALPDGPTEVPRLQVATEGTFEDDDLLPFAGRTIEAPPPTPKPDTPRPAAAAPAQNGARQLSGVVIKFGKSKGTPIEEATDRDLQWVSEAIAKSVDDPEKARFREQNERELAAIRAEIAYREGGGSEAPDDGFRGGSNPDDEIPF